MDGMTFDPPRSHGVSGMVPMTKPDDVWVAYGQHYEEVWIIGVFASRSAAVECTHVEWIKAHGRLLTEKRSAVPPGYDVVKMPLTGARLASP